MYQYDFRDNWQHEVLLVGTTLRSESFIRKLTGGERSFPPEGCGGLDGYMECVAIKNGQPVDLDPSELAMKKEWLCGWQPEEFELAVVQRRFDR